MVEKLHFLLIANGKKVSREKLLRLQKNCDQIIALDGAVNALDEYYQREILPDVILGDFDSIKTSSKHYFETQALKKAKIVLAESQDHSDLEKGIQYCDHHGAQSIHLVNAVGTTRMDHTFSNLNLLKRHFKKDRPIVLNTEKETLRFMRDGTLHLNGKVGAAAGIFGFPHAVVSSSGLQWDLKESPLELGGFQSSSNYLIQEEVILQIQGDALISFPEVPFRKKSGLKNKK